jgi:hypothetical protein
MIILKISNVAHEKIFATYFYFKFAHMLKLLILDLETWVVIITKDYLT